MRSGDDCPKCERGRMIVYSNRLRLEIFLRVNYLRCNCCRYKPDDNKELIPVDSDGKPVFARSGTEVIADDRQ